MKYILMQAPIESADYSSNIVIIDNSNIIGKHKIEKLLNEDYRCVGTIESDLRIQELKSGFEFSCSKKIDKAWELMKSIHELTENCF